MVKINIEMFEELNDEGQISRPNNKEGFQTEDTYLIMNFKNEDKGEK